MKVFRKYIAEPTKRTPGIILESGRIFIMGRSIPENPGDFYRPAFKWISSYVKKNTKVTSIELGFEYINTSSTKWIFNIIKEIAGMKDIAEMANVIWYYERGDEDMCELGLILKSLVDCPFSVVEVKEIKKIPDYQGVFLER